MISKIIKYNTLFILFIMICLGYCIQIDVISEFPIIQDNNLKQNDATKFSPRMQLSPYSGPEHLKELINQCFTLQDDLYKYTLCPFSNMTQEDVHTFYDSYKGILGIWGEWDIQDNKFRGMRLIEGSQCSEGTYRNTLVEMICGPINKLVSVKEPNHCNYSAVFETPLVCGQNAMIVYPRLANHLQQQWNDIYHEWRLDILTSKGYDRKLKDIFIEAGYLLTPEKKIMNKNAYTIEETNPCENEVQNLMKRIFELEEELSRIKEI